MQNTLWKKKLIVIACSTGGPHALQKIITKLPFDLNVAVLVVQHMQQGFTKSLAQGLNEKSDIRVKEAVDGEEIQKGTVYIAKSGCQMRLKQAEGQYRIALSKETAMNGLRPCADVLYQSLQDIPLQEILCITLTGMGNDSLNGILNLKKGKKVTVIAQDEKSCTIYGMPKAIIDAHLADQIIPLDGIADAIINFVEVQ